MASRTRQKEEARARRLAEERAHAERAQRTRRMQMLGGVVLLAAVVIAVVIAISVSGNSSKPAPKPGSSASNADVSAVSNVLNGIPQSGQTLGKPNAPVTITEYADLGCPVCDAFAVPTNRTASNGTPGTGYFDQLVSQFVRTGKAKIVYKSLETSTGNGPNASMWAQQQASAYAAGLQNKAWYYIGLFYYQQQPETTAYVTPAFLQGIAKQIPGLDVTKWASDSKSQTLQGQVASEMQAAVGRGFNSTPTLVIQGPKGQANPIVGLPSSFSQLASAVNSVS